MAYVFIDSGNLSGRGLSGRSHESRTRNTSFARGLPVHEQLREGLGRRAPRGLGDAGGSSAGSADLAARAQVEQLFKNTVAQWEASLNKALTDMPTFPLLAMNSARAFLKDAKEKLASQVMPIGLGVIRDTSIPLHTVQTRVDDFLTGYLDGLKAQMEIAKQNAQRNTMLGHLAQFRDGFRFALRSLVNEVVDTAAAAAKGLPPWLLPVAGLGLVGAGYLYWRQRR